MIQRDYDISLKKFENEKDIQIAAVDTSPKNRPEIRVNDKCQLFLKGCITIKTPITSAKVV